ncbi:uncharacterized protein LOC8275750 [Ricinus communis]|uniref:Uncharacterized protein n=1 Tax=Ricinus communis TaxID=3988 RepID=B9T2S5_RICCO|nr:uncharacterized protein LOC8275750 [Ricinus communis]EEF29838.1 hypothetical protein RCOM_0437740 [Ricinus communis]|eukprot:XP_002532544.1 uncharacterized protein LOC8275750 [Ricinus communis]
MAHQFPPNLDDGEHWLPSDILLNEVVLPAKYNNNSNNPNRFSCMEDLAAHFATLSLLKNHHSLTSLTPSRPIPNPSLCSQRVKMAVRDHLPTGYLGFDGGAGELSQRCYGYATGPFLSRSEPLYDFQVQPQQVDSYLEKTRSRFLQRQRHYLQDRVYPFQGSGFGGGGLRESAGTGVFHPRIVNPRIASSGGADVKRKQSGRSRQHPEIDQVTPLRNSTMRKVVVNNQEDCYYHLPPEMGLPQDWTY